MSHSSNDKVNWPNYILDAGLNRIHFGDGLTFKGSFIDLDIPYIKSVFGATGPQGFQGERGPVGEKGLDGLNGKDGQDGLNGLNGKDGEMGPQGPEGQKGNDCNPDIILDELETIKDKIKNETIIVKEKLVEVVKEKIVQKPVYIKEYIEVRTTKYIQTKDKKEDKVERFLPTSNPPSSIPGWIFDEKNNYYYKIKRGIKYIRVNKEVYREDEYIKNFKNIKPIRNGFHFGKTQ